MSIRMLAALVFALLVTCMIVFGEALAVRGTSSASRTPDRTDVEQAISVVSRYNHLVDEFNEEFPGIDGRGVTAAVIDAGAVRTTHVEFRKGITSSTRVTLLTSKPLEDQPTMVAGIIGSKGLNPRAKGLAPEVSLLSVDWDKDIGKLRDLGSRVQISNHSYAPPAGWARDGRSSQWTWYGDEKLSKDEDANFGKYRSKEAEFDRLLYDFPRLLAFTAAGNNRADNPDVTQPFSHLMATRNSAGIFQFRRINNQIHKPDSWDRGGLDTLTGLCLSKNAICVGSIGKIAPSEPIRAEDYSGWGPADDGRIKPDLVATGSHTLSTSAVDNQSYSMMTGTAMATPVGSGIAALLTQLYKKERGGPQQRVPTSAEIKAVLIHTATDAGIRGPDPVFGWGSINAQFAGQVIAQKNAAGKFRHYIVADRLATNENRKSSLVATGSSIKVTLVWTDPEGAPNEGSLDDPLPTLQNDLDLRLISSDGTVYYPYSLDPLKPLSPALIDGPNRVDNVEVVYVVRSKPGQKWRLEVSARKLRVGVSQTFALVITGLAENVSM